MCICLSVTASSCLLLSVLLFKLWEKEDKFTPFIFVSCLRRRIEESYGFSFMHCVMLLTHLICTLWLESRAVNVLTMRQSCLLCELHENRHIICYVSLQNWLASCFPCLFCSLPFLLHPWSILLIGDAIYNKQLTLSKKLIRKSPFPSFFLLPSHHVMSRLAVLVSRWWMSLTGKKNTTTKKESKASVSSVMNYQTAHWWKSVSEWEENKDANDVVCVIHRQLEKKKEENGFSAIS